MLALYAQFLVYLLVYISRLILILTDTLVIRILCTPGVNDMVCEVEEEATSIPALKSVESIVIRYPTRGGGDGAVQETNTMPIPFCLTIRLVGVLPG